MSLVVGILPFRGIRWMGVSICGWVERIDEA